MSGEEAIRAAVASRPEHCDAVCFAQRLASVRVELAGLDPAAVAELVFDAWAAKAPRRLLAAERERRAG